MEVEVAVLDTPSITVLMHGLCGRQATLNCVRAQELCGSRGGRPGHPVHNSPHARSLWTSSNIELDDVRESCSRFASDLRF